MILEIWGLISHLHQRGVLPLNRRIGCLPLLKELGLSPLLLRQVQLIVWLVVVVIHIVLNVLHARPQSLRQVHLQRRWLLELDVSLRWRHYLMALIHVIGPVSLRIVVSLLLVVHSLIVVILLLSMILKHSVWMVLWNLRILELHKNIVVLRRVWQSDWAPAYLIFMICFLNITARFQIRILCMVILRLLLSLHLANILIALLVLLRLYRCEKLGGSSIVWLDRALDLLLNLCFILGKILRFWLIKDIFLTPFRCK